MASFISGELLVVDFGSIIEENAGLRPSATMEFDAIMSRLKNR
jgi:hypothetical protein